MNKKSKRNGLIELWRFIACLSIAVFHYEWIYVKSPNLFIHLYIFVEFYFILSGFFLAANLYDKTDNSIKYVFKQFKKLYPLYLVSFIIVFIIKNISVNDVSVWILNIWSSKWEILLAKSFVFDNAITYNLGGAPDFISSLLFATLILHYILYKDK